MEVKDERHNLKQSLDITHFRLIYSTTYGKQSISDHCYEDIRGEYYDIIFYYFKT